MKKTRCLFCGKNWEDKTEEEIDACGPKVNQYNADLKRFLELARNGGPKTEEEFAFYERIASVIGDQKRGEIITATFEQPKGL